MNKLEARFSWEQVVTRTMKKLGTESKEFRDWMLSKENVGYLFDYGLFEYSYGVVKKLQKEGDHFSVIVAKEGLGKSTLASQISAVVSPTFSIGNTCFEPIQVIQNMKYGKRGDTIWIDEGGLILLAMDATTKEGKTLNKLFSAVRIKGFHFVICITNLAYLNKYVRTHRVDNIILLKKKLNKGKPELYYKLFNTRVNPLIIRHLNRGGSLNDFYCHNSDVWYGYWSDRMPIINDFSKESYAKLKDSNVDNAIDEAEGLLIAKPKLTPNLFDLARVMRITLLSRDTILKYAKEGRLSGKKVGGKWFITKESLENLGFIGTEPGYLSLGSGRPTS